MKIAWLGSVVNSELQSKNAAISLASNYWQGDFIKGLESLSIKTTTISTIPHRTFPIGPLLVKPKYHEFENLDFILYDYVNVKWFRDWSKVKGIDSSLELLNDIDALISYNAYPECRISAAKYSSLHQIPWIEVCADAWESKPGWELICGEEKVPDGYVFLSAEAHKRCPDDNKILIHGGVSVNSDLNFSHVPDKWGQAENDSLVFLYSGSFEYWSGLTLLLKSFLGLPDYLKGILIICGYGTLSYSDRLLIESNSNIQFFGTVDKLELDRLRKKADILVNPRPQIAENIFNFPSKLLEYMSYKKIIVSTQTPGIPSNFSSMMILTEGNVDGFSAGLLKAAQMTKNDRETILNSLEIYCSTHTWHDEAKRLSSFLEMIIKEA
jgi:glycosyltransferase involved in cell wall biosynthesis